MKTKLSALLDGELTDEEVAQLFSSHGVGECVRECLTYPLIGDALRGERTLHADITGAVMQQLEGESVVLAPRRRAAQFHRPLLALAASVAGVGVVAWLALSQIPQQASVTTVAAVGTPSTEVRPLASAEMQEYVISHQAQSSGLRLQGGAEHIRTVSLGYAK